MRDVSLWKQWIPDALDAMGPDPLAGMDHWPAHESVDLNEPKWGLFVAKDLETARRAASAWVAKEPGLPTFELSPEATVPLALHRGTFPQTPGPRRVVLALDNVFFANWKSGSFSLCTPLYVFSRLHHLASPNDPSSPYGGLSVMGLGSESALLMHAQDIFHGRGLAHRFDVYRESAAVAPASAYQEIDPDTWETDAFRNPDPLNPLARFALTTRDVKLRARICARMVETFSELGLAHLFWGASLAERNKLRDAAQSLSKAIALDSELASASFELGKVLIRLDDMPGAIAAFRRTTELLPEFSSGWANYGAALGEIEDPRGALAALTQAIRVDPLSHSLHSNLGVTHRDLGQLDAAESSFRRALELAPDFVFGHYNLAQVLYLQNLFDEAIEWFEKANEMAASPSPRQQLLLAITRLASGDLDAANDGYRRTFETLDPSTRRDMRQVAEWDLKQLAQRQGISENLKQVAKLLRTLAPSPKPKNS